MKTKYLIIVTLTDFENAELLNTFTHSCIADLVNVKSDFLAFIEFIKKHYFECEINGFILNECSDVIYSLPK